MSWVPGIRNTGAQSNADKTTAVVGPSKSATEELVGLEEVNFQYKVKGQRCQMSLAGLNQIPNEFLFGVYTDGRFLRRLYCF